MCRKKLHNVFMSEKNLANKLEKKNPNLLWKHISDKFGVGTPDRCLLSKSSSDVYWTELKFLTKLPKKKCKIGIRPKQAAWLEQWNKYGGSGFVIVGFGDSDKVCILHKDFVKVLSEGIEIGEIELIEINSVEEKIREIKYGRKN